MVAMGMIVEHVTPEKSHAAASVGAPAVDTEGEVGRADIIQSQPGFIIFNLLKLFRPL